MAQRQAGGVVALRGAGEQEPASSRAPRLGRQQLRLLERGRARRPDIDAGDQGRDVELERLRPDRLDQARDRRRARPCVRGRAGVRGCGRRRRSARRRRASLPALLPLGPTYRPRRAAPSNDSAAAATFWRSQWTTKTDLPVPGDNRPGLNARSGRRDERRPAPRSLLARRDQRLLRRCRVRPGALAPRPPRGTRLRGRRRRRGGARAAGEDRRIALGLSGRDHDGLDRHRLPRRAGAEGPDRADLRRPLARGRRRRSPSSRLHARDVAAHHRRRAGAEDPRDHARRERRRAALARPLDVFAVDQRSVHPRPDGDRERDPAPVRRRLRRHRREAHDART